MVTWSATPGRCSHRTSRSRGTSRTATGPQGPAGPKGATGATGADRGRPAGPKGADRSDRARRSAAGTAGAGRTARRQLDRRALQGVAGPRRTRGIVGQSASESSFSIVDQNGQNVGVATDAVQRIASIAASATTRSCSSHRRHGPTAGPIDFYHATADCSDSRYLPIVGRRRLRVLRDGPRRHGVLHEDDRPDRRAAGADPGLRAFRSGRRCDACRASARRWRSTTASLGVRDDGDRSGAREPRAAAAIEVAPRARSRHIIRRMRRRLRVLVHSACLTRACRWPRSHRRGRRRRPATDAAAGRRIFDAQCAWCHGNEGDGGTGPEPARPAAPRHHARLDRRHHHQRHSRHRHAVVPPGADRTQHASDGDLRPVALARGGAPGTGQRGARRGRVPVERLRLVPRRRGTRRHSRPGADHHRRTPRRGLPA